MDTQTLAGISEGETARKLLEYHRNIVRILPSYPKILKVISAEFGPVFVRHV